MAQTKASEKYVEKFGQLAILMKAFEKKLTAHTKDQQKNPANWGYVGDMDHFIDLFRQLNGKG